MFVKSLQGCCSMTILYLSFLVLSPWKTTVVSTRNKTAERHHQPANPSSPHLFLSSRHLLLLAVRLPQSTVQAGSSMTSAIWLLSTSPLDWVRSAVIFGCRDWTCVTGIQWTEARAAVKPSQDGPARSYPARSIGSALVEKPCSVQSVLVKAINDFAA